MNKNVVIYELVDMKNWRTKNDILNELMNMDKKCDERFLRMIFEKNNALFVEHERDL